MTFARPSSFAGAALATVLLSASCGSGTAPVTPAAPVVVAPAPPPSDAGEGASANSCPLGKGDPAADCARRSPALLAAMDTAIDLVVRSRPELFNTGEEAGADTGQYRVLDRDAYLDGVIANLRAAGLCAERSLDRERVRAKSSNAFSEEWDVLTSSGFIRRGSYAYQQTCEPAVFPVDAQDLVAYVRTVFFSLECNAGVPPPPGETLPLGCDGFVTATPKQRNGTDVPSWIHGSDIEWELREGEDVVQVEPDTRFSNPFNKILHTTGKVGGFILCASVLGKTGCLNGRTIP